MIRLEIVVKNVTILFVLFLPALAGRGQDVSADNLLSMTDLPKAKLSSYIIKKGFKHTGKDFINDTSFNFYQFRKQREKGDTTVDSSLHFINEAQLKDANCIIYQTSEFTEFGDLVNQLKKKGFYTNQSADSLSTQPLIFQHNQYLVRTFFTLSDSTKLFNLRVSKNVFPNPKDVVYADDLLAFTSHESLVYYFGKNNVKSDVYFFSENEVNRCSVLFLNTSRQVVYIWKDDINKCGIDHLLFGGQQKLASLSTKDNFVAENNWLFKSGVHAGMSLYELIKLNDNDFKFYGANSANSGLILADNSGKLNFKKENIVLSCINCRDDKFSNMPVISASDALSEEKILFVLTISLTPETSTVP
ncbi:hypothetical protein QWZ08_00780 [Ferruginibacter paludis]|nr:hypothetical protein [Ferruginibacter paludis]